MTVKPAWARKGYRPRPQADRPLWRLTPDEQRVLLITFAGVSARSSSVLA